MRILILSQWFYPEPHFKGLPFALELKKNGHDVQVLTGFPNYPNGKIYPGYKQKLFQMEYQDGIEIIRVPLFPSHDRSGLKRILNYLSFAIFASFLGPFLIKKADVQYVYHPPATVAMPAILLKFLRRIPIAYDIQDLWPDTLKSTGMVQSQILLKAIDFYCKVCYRLFDQIIVQSEGFRNCLIKRRVSSSKITIVYNWSSDLDTDIDSHANSKNSMCTNYFNNRFTVLFAGTMGRAQALESVLDAAALLYKYPSIYFVFIGGGIEVNHLKQYSNQLRLSNVLFLQRVEPKEIGNVLISADVLLVHLKDDPLFRITIPSKTQTYLRIGKPILMAVKGDAAKIIEEAQAGLLAEPQNPDSIAEKILQLYNLDKSQLNLMGQNGKNYYKQCMAIEQGTKDMIRIFKLAAV